MATRGRRIESCIREEGYRTCIGKEEPPRGKQIRMLEQPFKNRNTILDTHGRDFLTVGAECGPDTNQ
jgi:hypothetical protein